MEGGRLATVGVADLGLGVQACTGDDEFDPRNAVHRPAPTAGPSAKPRDGFFTSSWDGCSSPRIDPMRQLRMRSGLGRVLWLLVPDPNARLYVIATHDDHERLADTYPRGWDNASVKNPDRAPDWYRIAGPQSLVDGVHVTGSAAAGFPRGRRDLRPFGGWDVESTLWFSYRFARQDRLGALADDWTLTGTDPSS
jgi:hypothetical protein